jgi:hypothetical protein
MNPLRGCGLYIWNCQFIENPYAKIRKTFKKRKFNDRMERFEVLIALNLFSNFQYSRGNIKKYFHFLNNYLRIWDHRSHTVKLERPLLIALFRLYVKKAPKRHHDFLNFS